MRQLPQREARPELIAYGVDTKCFEEKLREPAYIREGKEVKRFDEAYSHCGFEYVGHAPYDIAATPERKKCMVSLIRQGMNFWEAAHRCTRSPYRSIRRMRWAGTESNSWLWIIAAVAGFWLLMKE